VSDVLVVGGGFAGVAAACRLAGEGHRPTLLERAPRLGGRASSFVSPALGETIDYAHHVLMRCCTASTGFLARIGMRSSVRFQPTLAVPIVSPSGSAALRSSFLTGALHLAPALLRYALLPLRARLQVARAAVALAHGPRPQDTYLADWLERHGQSPAAVQRLWNPICIATLNATANQVSLLALRKVLRDAFLHPDGADMGLFSVPLSELFDAAARYITSHGGTVLRNAGAARILVDDEAVRGVELLSGQCIEARSVVSAVAPEHLSAIASAIGPLAEPLDRAQRLRWSPIVDLHAWFDRPILPEQFAIGVESPAQAMFDLTRIHDRPSDLTHIVLSQSAASEWIDRPPTDVAEELISALDTLFPKVRQATAVRTLVLRHRQATFIPEPGAGSLRPRTVTPISGLYLAGDWTATGWPATIEGAIRSGVTAAAYVEEQLARDAEEHETG